MRVVVTGLALALAFPQHVASQPTLMGPHDLQAIPFKAADVRIAYGSDDSQFGELRVPPGPGPHPVVVLVHGGCFKATYASLKDLSPMADALKAEGVATWNLEYRRLGQAGAGWPGTYRDVGQGVDHLRALAAKYRLDLKRVIVVGHSAGGHLAMWSAVRRKLTASSPLGSPNPLGVRGVVNLAGPINMRDNIRNYEAECRDPVVTRMMDGGPSEKPENYAQASAGDHLPLGARQVLIWGEHENFVPRSLAESHIERAKAAGDDASLVVVRGAGHFEIASPKTAAWPIVSREIFRLLKSD
jgi:acetyl esterase/lipase